MRPSLKWWKLIEKYYKYTIPSKIEKLLDHRRFKYNTIISYPYMTLDRFQKEYKEELEEFCYQWELIYEVSEKSEYHPDTLKIIISRKPEVYVYRKTPKTKERT